MAVVDVADDTKREDRRTRYTKQVIREAFFELLREKGFDKMSVADICRRADINRGTFYLHYVDKYDLLDALIDEALDEEPPFDEREHTLCQRVPVNDDYRLLYQGDETLPHVMRHIIERGGAASIPEIMERSGLDEEMARMAFIFAASGNMAVNKQMGWKRSKRFNEVQALMREIFYAGLDHVGRRSG